MKPYNHEEVENNWKKHWYEDNIYEAKDFDTRPKKYILAELPYPSGKSLHVGHMMRYTVPEIYSRFLRMRGYNVLFPMGWDCFGLPAETYAKKEGITPQEAIAQATVDYKRAMQDMGYAIDWSREINTADPSYYKWTQWTFKKLWENGLAVQKEMPVWWCDELGVLADEEVLPNPKGEGKVSERGGYEVKRKLFKQWVLDIPKYADRLIEDLSKVDYQDSIKQAQKNWIDRKDGANIIFDVMGEKVEVFTTRPDTILGVTFLALSPIHPVVEKLSDKIKNISEVNAYIKEAESLSDLERQTKEKTGVALEGVFATNPYDPNLPKVPVFIADYILMDFGTGAVMGVPGHDSRDFDFANKYHLPIIEVVKKPEGFDGIYTEDGEMINSGKHNGINSKDFYNLVISELEKQGTGKKAKEYKLRPQVFSRQRYWGEPIPLRYKQDGEIEALEDSELPLELPVMKDFLPGKDGISPLAKNKEWMSTKDSMGNMATRESDTMPTWAGSNWYYLRYIDPANDKSLADLEKIKYWFPVDMYFGDAGHTNAHLLYTRFWFKFLYDIGQVPLDEPFMYRMSGGMLLGPDNQKMSKSRGNVIIPKEVLENYGADAVRTYLAFIGPYEDTYPWNPNGLVACARLVKSIYEAKYRVGQTPASADLKRALHLLIKNVTEMMEKLKMNTSVSEIMIFNNQLKKEKEIPLEIWKPFIQIIAPFMPFVAEELWQDINDFKEWKKENSIHLQAWPIFDPTLLTSETVSIPVQINGKVRSKYLVKGAESEKEIVQNLLNDPLLKMYFEDKKIIKTIYIKNKIINLVVA